MNDIADVLTKGIVLQFPDQFDKEITINNNNTTN